MENKTSINHENGNDANRLLAARKNTVLCTERMPTKAGYYRTNIGLVFLEQVPQRLGLKAGFLWQFGQTPEWWEE